MDRRRRRAKRPRDQEPSRTGRRRPRTRERPVRKRWQVCSGRLRCCPLRRPVRARPRVKRDLDPSTICMSSATSWPLAHYRPLPDGRGPLRPGRRLQYCATGQAPAPGPSLQVEPVGELHQEDVVDSALAACLPSPWKRAARLGVPSQWREGKRNTPYWTPPAHRHGGGQLLAELGLRAKTLLVGGGIALFIVVAIMAMEVMPMVMLPSSKTNAASEPGPAPAAVAAKAPEPPRAKIEARVKFTGMQFVVVNDGAESWSDTE